MLNAAVIGVGAMGKNHARVYSDMEGVRLVAVSDTHKENLAHAKEKLRCRAYPDYKKMLDKETIDIVSVVVPTTAHLEVASDCLNKGIHVLVEKPITSTIDEGRKLIELAHRKRKKLMVGHIERFNPAIIELRKRIDNSELGKVFKIDVNRVGPFPSRIRDVGVVIDLAVHDIDIMRYLTDSEVKSVFAMTENRVHTSHEDLLSGLMRFENGVICNLNINWLTPTKIRKLFITGEKGMFVADYLKQELCYYENAQLTNNADYMDRMMGVSEGIQVCYHIAKKEPLLGELEHFVDCVQNDCKPLISGEDGLLALAIANNLIRSAETGRSV